MKIIIGCLSGIVLLLLSTSAARSAEERLPGTELLTVERPLDEVMVAGLQRFCLRELTKSRDLRAERWVRDFANEQAYSASVASNRERLRNVIGAVDARVTSSSSVERRIELLAALDQSSVLARGSWFMLFAGRCSRG